MKYAVLLCDGMADVPVPALGGKTPMEAADIPHMDTLFQTALAGLATTVPENYPAGSDVANLSVFGYAPETYYTGRSPLEAVSMGLTMRDGEAALRCNLVTLGGEGPLASRTMEDYSAGEISTGEARVLMTEVAAALDGPDWSFHGGISYRHCMLWMNGPLDIRLTPPHDISGQPIVDFLPKGPGAAIVQSLIAKSMDVLANHPVNLARVAAGKNPANAIWLWGQGSKPSLPLFTSLYGLRGAVISAVDLIKGIGLAAGLISIDVPGATGNYHTNYRGKADAALRVLREAADFVYIHVEAPDECGHQGQVDQKRDSLSRIDAELLAPLLQGLRDMGDFRLLIMPDHPTPLHLRTHTREPVPFLLYDSRRDQSVPGQAGRFSEATARATGLYLPKADRLMGQLLERA
jgi:2,3-bisphosphoglycerate-independent phosphoglycerate mutase